MSYESDAFCCEIFCLSFNIKYTSKTGLNAQVKKSWSSWDDETDGSLFSISRFTQLHPCLTRQFPAAHNTQSPST